jgi:hypothetical protein
LLQGRTQFDDSTLVADGDEGALDLAQLLIFRGRSGHVDGPFLAAMYPEKVYDAGIPMQWVVEKFCLGAPFEWVRG